MIREEYAKLVQTGEAIDLSLLQAAHLYATSRPSFLLCAHLEYEEWHGKWIAVHGDLRAEGRTPNEAFAAFDRIWFAHGQRGCGTHASVYENSLPNVRIRNTETPKSRRPSQNYPYPAC